MALEQELALYTEKLAEMLEHEGKFVLIHGNSIAGYWTTADEALQAGYDQFGLEPFLVKEVARCEQPKYFSRNLSRCRS